MIELRAGLEIVDADEGKVLLDSRQGVYWHLNEAAISLLEELRDGRSLDDIVRDVAHSAQVEEDRVRSDYLALIDELRKAKLIKGRLP